MRDQPKTRIIRGISKYAPERRKFELWCSENFNINEFDGWQDFDEVRKMILTAFQLTDVSYVWEKILALAQHDHQSLLRFHRVPIIRAFFFMLCCHFN